MKTSLNEIRNSTIKPCKYSWEKLLASLGKTQADDAPIEMTYILNTLGVTDAIWVLRNSKGRADIPTAFVADCAKHVLHVFEGKYPDDNRPRLAIEAARDPDRSREDKLVASDTVCTAAACTAAAGAAYAAADAAYAAAAAADAGVAADVAVHAAIYAAATGAIRAAADPVKEREWQVEYMRKILENEQ